MHEGILGFQIAVPLVTALVVERASSAGLRILCIKGPFLAAQGLRPSKLSVDLDVLVHPADIDHLVRLLMRDGWSRRDPIGVRLAIEPHSVTLVHPYWPCMIDVHKFWVGFLAAPDVVFESLWNKHETVNVAGCRVPTTDVASSAILLALNELRSSTPEDVAKLLDDLAGRVREQLGPEAPALLEEAARVMQAEHTAQPLLVRAGVSIPPPNEPSRELRDWLLRIEIRDESTAGWLLLLKRTPWYKKPVVIVDALALRPSALRAMRPGSQPGIGGLWSAWLARFRKGLRHFRRARGELSVTHKSEFHQPRRGSRIQR